MCYNKKMYDLHTPHQSGLEAFGPEGWKNCTPQSLRGHIVNIHLEPRNLVLIGVPRYDIEVAEARELDLDWVVKKAIQRMGMRRAELQGITRGELTGLFDIARYRELVAKTLKVIDMADLAEVNWDLVNTLHPGASELEVNPFWDIHDTSFQKIQQGREVAQLGSISK